VQGGVLRAVSGRASASRIARDISHSCDAAVAALLGLPARNVRQLGDRVLTTPGTGGPSHSGIAHRESLLGLTLCATMEGMADTITFRPDEDASRALAVLTRDGTPVSAAVRAALIDAARERARATLRAEAEALAADEQDRAEAAQVLRDMESLRAW
jgi:hypothetical protein